MQRDIIAKLNAWKASEYRKPLILKGARQVGKTWALKEFGRTSYLNFVYLTLEDTENKVSYARQSYNDCVLSYNNAIQTFPAVIFAGIFQFKERQGFEAAEAARQAPTVKF